MLNRIIRSFNSLLAVNRPISNTTQTNESFTPEFSGDASLDAPNLLRAHSDRVELNRRNIHCLEKSLSDLYNIHYQLVHHRLDEFYDVLDNIRIELESLLIIQYSNIIRSPNYQNILSISSIPNLPIIAMPDLIIHFSQLIDSEFGINSQQYIPYPIINETLSIPSSTSEFRASAPASPLQHMLNTLPITNIKTLKNMEFDTICIEDCGICLEKHTKVESIECGCLHNFGKECFKNWMNTCQLSNKIITCPSCRENIISITEFVDKAESKT